MFFDLLTGLGLPFLGTSLGAACVLLMKKAFGQRTERVLNGAAAGIMVAASIWSLLIPAIEQCSAEMGCFAFLPAAAGFALGIVFLALLDRFIPQPDIADGKAAQTADKRLMILAVTIHNVPEGMAVGVVYAGLIYCGGSAYPRNRYSDTEFPRGRDSFYAAARVGDRKSTRVSDGCAFGSRRACRGSSHDSRSKPCCARDAVSAELCCGSYVLCCCRRAYT